MSSPEVFLAAVTSVSSGLIEGSNLNLHQNLGKAVNLRHVMLTVIV